MLTIQGSRAST